LHKRKEKKRKEKKRNEKTKNPVQLMLSCEFVFIALDFQNFSYKA
jgi:hypothetical protein